MSSSSFETLVQASLARLGEPTLLQDYNVELTSSYIRGRVPIRGIGSILNVALFEAQPPPHFDRSRLKFTTKHVQVPEHIKLSVPDEELREFYDDEAVLAAKIRMLAHHIRQCPREGEFVVHTGAGISTAAKIPDFRGPNGVWTARDRNLPAPKSVPMEIAEPTYSHRVLVKWLEDGILSYLVSQNVDGLHRRSGVEAEKISELHGNCFKEICADCGAEFLRTYDVKRRKGPHFEGVRDHRSLSGISHITGRKCTSCGEGMLRDSIIHFRENLPEVDLERAMEHAKRARTTLCIGSSLHVTPAADIPTMSENPHHCMFIINLQATGRDVEALETGGLLIHGKCDDVMRLLARELGTEADVNDREEEMAVAPEEEEDDDDIEVGVQPSSSSAAAMQRAAHAHFFEELGLPPTLQQLPPSLVLTQTHTNIASSSSSSSGNKHQWSLSLDFPGYPLGKEDLIDRVEYHLHPTFEPNVITVDKLPFNLENMRGWGEFEVNVYVHLHPGMLDYPVKIAHQLRFDRPMCMTQVKVPQMKVAPGFKENLRERSFQLRPTRTRVRRHDGSTYIEPPLQHSGGGGGGGGYGGGE